MKHETATSGIELVALGEGSVEKAQARVVACQSCSPSVFRAFGSVLTEVLGATALATEYMVCAPAQCPNCGQPIDERTMVRCEGECGEFAAPTFKDFSPCWEDTNVVLVDEDILAEAQAVITGCERCVPRAEMTFDYILDAVMGCDPAITEYVLCHSGKCPRCNGEVSEKTFVLAQ